MNQVLTRNIYKTCMRTIMLYVYTKYAELVLCKSKVSSLSFKHLQAMEQVSFITGFLG
jgi:hypothetical protein